MKGLSVFLYIVSLGLVIFGFITAYHYGDYNSDYNSSGSMFGHVVGGDAYNYTIMAGRGALWAIAGLVTTVIASALLIVEAVKSAEYRVQTSTDRIEYQFREAVREVKSSEVSATV